MIPEDLKRPQKIELVKPNSAVNRTTNNKNKLKGGSMCEIVEINDEYLDEILLYNSLYMELAMQIVSNDQTVRSNAVQDLKESSSQSVSTQARKGEHLVSLMPAIKKAFVLLGDDIVELST